MKLQVNGEAITLSKQTQNLLHLIEQYKLNPGGVVAEHNGTIYHHEQFAEIILKNNDKIELIQFVGGG